MGAKGWGAKGDTILEGKSGDVSRAFRPRILAALDRCRWLAVRGAARMGVPRVAGVLHRLPGEKIEIGLRDRRLETQSPRARGHAGSQDAATQGSQTPGESCRGRWRPRRGIGVMSSYSPQIGLLAICSCLCQLFRPRRQTRNKRND
jgi:hypothetical protein